MKHGARALTILLLLLFAIIGTAQNTSDSALSAYQRIQAESRYQRVFRYEDGAPKKGDSPNYKSFTDATGYLWIVVPQPLGVYRFNGTGFQDMLKVFPSSERDSLLFLLQTNEKVLFVGGKRFLYRWEGYKFSKFRFPMDDTIKKISDHGSRIVCLGSKGFAILDKDKWKYIRTSLKSPYEDYESITVTVTAGERITYKIKQTEHEMGKKDLLIRSEFQGMCLYDSNTGENKIIPTLWNDDYALDCFSSKGKNKIPVLDKARLAELFKQNTILAPKLFRSAQGLVYLYFYNTNMLFRIDEEKLQAVPVFYPENCRLIQFEINRNGDNWAFYYEDKNLIAKQFDSPITQTLQPIRLSLDKTELDFNALIQIDGDFYSVMKPNIEDDWNQTKAFKAFPGLEEIMPVALPKISYINDTRSPYFSKGKYLVFSSPDASLSQVHNVYINDFEKPMRQFKVIDPAPYLDILDFNEDSSVVMLAGKEQIIAVSLDKICEEVFTFEKPARSEPSFSFGNYIMNYSSGNRGLVYRHWNDRIEKILDLNNSIAFSIDHKSQIINYFTIEPAKPGSREVSVALYAYLQKTKKTKLLAKPERSAGFAFWTGKSLVIDKDFGYAEYSEDLIAQGKLTALKAKLDSLVANSGVTSQQVLDKLIDKDYISDDVLYFAPHRLTIKTEPEGKILQTAVVYGANDEAKQPERFAYIKTNDAEILEIPPFTYGLRSDKLTERSNWLSATKTTSYDLMNNSTFVIHRKKTKTGSWQLRSSRFEGDRLVEYPNDWLLEYNGSVPPEVKKFRHYKNMFFRVQDKLYYQHKTQWKSISVKQFLPYGDVQGITPIGEDIWICCKNALIRYSLNTGQFFAFTGKNGIPENLEMLYLSGSKMFLLANSGVYSFNPDEGNAILMLPWLQVRNQRFNSTSLTKLKHNQNDIIIPVDVLNTLVPERIRLSYRLLGYEKDWKHRDYSPQIEYPKLPPGVYEFQINATSPTGRQSKTLSLFFTINPPFYATWWAYLIYAAGLFVLGRYLYKLRIRQLKARNLALENTVALRTMELREWQQRTRDSIEYASLIQKSVLPQASDLQQAFAEHFIIWKPRDIVGGDFYWLHTLDGGEVLFAIIDCTGHGVPGALLSMTVNSLLDHLVHDRGIHQPADIFSELHRKIGSTLHQDKAQTQQDGIEIALLKIDKAARQLVFCGAGLHVLHYDMNHKELIHIRGNKYGLGGLKWHQELLFDEQVLDYSTDSRFYLYTDGIIDQPVPRHDKERRFGHPGWLELVSQWAELPLGEQNDLFSGRLATMLAYHEQRDDITIVGFRIE